MPTSFSRNFRVKQYYGNLSSLSKDTFVFIFSKNFTKKNIDASAIIKILGNSCKLNDKSVNISISKITNDLMTFKGAIKRKRKLEANV